MKLNMAVPIKTCFWFRNYWQFAKYLRNPQNLCNCLGPVVSRTYSAQTSEDPPDVSHLFTETRVQELIRRITQTDCGKVFRPRKEALNPPQYKLVTNEELKQMYAKAEEEAESYLQFPPVCPPRKSIDEVLSKDIELDQHDDAKYVFTDITFGVSNRDRTIVVREPNGALRQCSWEERHRMNQIYHPLEGRKIHMPKVFEPEYLEAKLNDGSYLYVLDRAVVQFDPDDPKYIQVVERSYSHVDNNKKHDVLRSTRHFGGFVFYLVSHEKVENLLLDMIQRDFLNDAVALVKLYHIIHPACKSVTECKNIGEDDPVQFIKTFVKLDVTHAGEVELALQAYEDDREKATS